MVQVANAFDKLQEDPYVGKMLIGKVCNLERIVKKEQKGQGGLIYAVNLWLSP